MAVVAAVVLHERDSIKNEQSEAKTVNFAEASPLINLNGATEDANGDGIIDHLDEKVVIMVKATVGFKGIVVTADGETVSTLDGVMVHVINDDGDLEEKTAEEVGLEVKDDSKLPMASLGKCLEISDDPESEYRYLCQFETDKNGMVKCWVKGEHLEGMPDMGRSLLLDVVSKMTARHDAFVTLPQTMVYIVVFIFLVSGHLRVFERHQLESGLEDWINGRNPMTSCENTVDDIYSFWTWLDGDSGLEGVFAVQKQSLVNKDHTQFFVASRSVVIGDVQVTYTKFDGTEKSQWLLQQDDAKRHLADNPGDWDLSTGEPKTRYVDAAKIGAKKLAEDGWLSQDISKMSLVFAAYSEKSKFYSVVEVLVRFRENGATIPKINAEVVSILPYPSYVLLVFDFIYFCFVAKMFVGEGREVFGAASMGLGELADYFGFWNCVDWASIIFGFLVMGIWAVIFVTMGGDKLHSILNDDMQIKDDVMNLPSSSIEELHEAISGLRVWFMVLHLCMACNTVSIVVKFFKGFTSNPRLTVVTATFDNAKIDFAHFGIIFFTIFLPFALIGHVLFGNDITEFSSIFSSINTSFLVLMGEFGWYVDCCGMASEMTLLPSGMPAIVVFTWFVIYMFLVFLVLLNMLLAIIIKHYEGATHVIGELPESQRPTLWVQTKEYRKFKRETKGFIPLEEILADLNNDDEMAHPMFHVTVDSLQKSWKDMSEKNAQWIYDTLSAVLKDRRDKEAEKQEENVDSHVEHMDRSVSVVDKHIMQAHEETHEILEMVEHMADMVRKTNKLSQMKMSQMGVIPDEEEEEDDTDAGELDGENSAKFKALNDSTSTIQSQLLSMEQTMAKIQRDQARLGKRLDELAANAPGAGEKNSGQTKDLASKLRERNNLKKQATDAPGAAPPTQTAPGGVTLSGLRE